MRETWSKEHHSPDQGEAANILLRKGAKGARVEIFVTKQSRFSIVENTLNPPDTQKDSIKVSERSDVSETTAASQKTQG